MTRVRNAPIALWLLCCTVAALALLAPALWNGFPLIYPDTGGYLERPLTGTLEMGRSALYGTFLLAGAPLALWPNVVAQAVIIVWLVALTLRAHGLGGRPMLVCLVVVALASATALPFFASHLMPDVLFPAGVLALYLLVFHRPKLRTFEQAGLCAAIVFALASHMALLGLALGLLVVLGLLSAFPVLRLPKPQLPLAIYAVLAGLIFAPLSNLVITGQLAFTPGGASFFFNRLVEDGIVTRYLDKKCPDASLRICAYRADISTGYDDWLWKNDTPFWKLGGWQGYSGEQRRIILATLVTDPIAHMTTAVRATLIQFVSFNTEVATDRHDNSRSRDTFRDRLPRLYSALMAARQQASPFDVSPFNIIHVPVATLSIIALGAALIGRRRLALSDEEAALAATVLFALAVNAAVCGIFSHPADRYQSRLVPIAPLAVMVLALSRRRTT
jgi:hypothetical protein